MTDPNLTTACLQVAGRLLTQREARNGYQSSHLALVNRSDLTLAMNLLATASTRIEGLEAAVELQGAAAADANAQLNSGRAVMAVCLYFGRLMPWVPRDLWLATVKDVAAAIGAEFGKRCANKKHTGV